MAAEASEFYSTAAQIIPVLYLAIAFQARGDAFFDDQVAQQLFGWSTAGAQIARSLLAVLLSTILAAGEAAALYGLANGTPLEFTPGHTSSIVAWSMAWGEAL